VGDDPLEGDGKRYAVSEDLKKKDPTPLFQLQCNDGIYAR
jgi:hypothetical protein